MTIQQEIYVKKCKRFLRLASEAKDKQLYEKCEKLQKLANGYAAMFHLTFPQPKKHDAIAYL